MVSCKAYRVYFLFLLATVSARGADQEITGIQPAALDQPRIYMLLRRTPAGPPLAAKGDKGLAGLLGIGKDGDKDAATFTIEAFLDTGASGIMLSSDTANALGIQPAKFNDQPVTFEDVGVAGSERFGVSEPLVPSFAAYSSTTAGDDPAVYSKVSGPLRLQIRPPGGILDMLTGGLDVAGMPAMANRVVVIDPKPLNSFADKLRTSVLPPNNASIPKTACHIPLTYVSFQRFTRTTPAGAPPPALLPNPMIGPDPLKIAATSLPSTAPTSRTQGWTMGSNNKRVLTLGGSAPANPTTPTVAYNGRSAAITFLLDTGSAASLISRRTADQLGIHYTADGSKLQGIPDNQQFSLTIGGIGGNKTASGFYLDSLSLPARERQPIVFKKAPVLVHDISVHDPATGQTFTLDGVLGMNYLVASANVTGGLLPDIKDLTQGPFSIIVIDHAHATLGVTIAGN